MYNVDAFGAIITPPQAAVLAVGSVSDRVVPVAGKPGIRPMMTMTLSSDHRVVDGARAAEFLSELTNAIREPEKVL
jgi:pyruvate dehydrogenase E2 component (dihydrolipoamide acetyltransferase)